MNRIRQSGFVAALLLDVSETAVLHNSGALFDVGRERSPRFSGD